MLKPPLRGQGGGGHAGSEAGAPGATALRHQLADGRGLQAPQEVPSAQTEGQCGGGTGGAAATAVAAAPSSDVALREHAGTLSGEQTELLSADREFVEQHAFDPGEESDGGTADDRRTAQAHGYHSQLHNEGRDGESQVADDLAVAGGTVRLDDDVDSAPQPRISRPAAVRDLGLPHVQVARDLRHHDDDGRATAATVFPGLLCAEWLAHVLTQVPLGRGDE